MTASPLLLGIDGGQTATKSLLATTEGEVLATGLGGPSDHFHIDGGVEKNRVAIHGAIESALAAADRPGNDVVAVGLGSTGVPSEGEQNLVIVEIIREMLPHLDEQRISINPDYKTNLLGASGGQPGVVLIAGGGCISYGITVDSKEGIAGGYGFLIGDQGSAFDIGLRAIDAATKSEDRRGPETALEWTVCEYFGLDRIRLITRVVYAAGFSRDRIARLAPEVVKVAESGDEVAKGLLAGSAGDAADTALGVIRQLYEPGDRVRVYLTGGVFKAGPLVRGPFDLALHAGWPQAEAAEPRFPPVVGTLIAGAQAAGIDVDEQWLRWVEETLVDLQGGT
ncbi:MAG: hypothetical protein KF883_00255 [Thermomicrobiales bacterium]|nr:hypothetical protein [Thermomicrobiales bacterium]